MCAEGTDHSSGRALWRARDQTESTDHSVVRAGAVAGARPDGALPTVLSPLCCLGAAGSSATQIRQVSPPKSGKYLRCLGAAVRRSAGHPLLPVGALLGTLCRVCPLVRMPHASAAAPRRIGRAVVLMPHMHRPVWPRRIGRPLRTSLSLSVGQMPPYAHTHARARTSLTLFRARTCEHLLTIFGSCRRPCRRPCRRLCRHPCRRPCRLLCPSRRPCRRHPCRRASRQLPE